MDIYDFRDYRKLMRARIELFPRKGYGQLNLLAKALGTQASLLSQVLGGTRDLSEDQGYLVCEFFEFNEREASYFLLLLQYERAGSQSLRRFLEKKISASQQESRKVRNRITVERELTHENQAIFYSDWLFAAIHTLSSIRAYQSVEAIAEHLGVSRSKVSEVAAWLIEHGLCKDEKGRLVVGPLTTYVDRESILAARHHANWRQKGLEVVGDQGPDDFFFTVPFSISAKDYAEIRKEFIQVIDRLAKRLTDTEPEVMAVLNIDLFKS